MKNVAIIGGGPTALYTLTSLLTSQSPLAVTVFEKGAEIGSGMPYSSGTATPSMMSNIAGFEIPPVVTSLKDWLVSLDRPSLADMQLDPDAIDDRTYYGRLVLGRYFQAQLSELVSKGRGRGHHVTLRRHTKVVDIMIEKNGIAVSWTDPVSRDSAVFDEVVIATGHSWTRNAKANPSEPTLIPLWPIKDVNALAGDDIGVFGTSLSGIDAVVAIAERHGEFVQGDQITWSVRRGHTVPKIAMLSRKGLLPEADYYYPFPLPELATLTRTRVEEECQQGQSGLLVRIFTLFAADLKRQAPRWLPKTDGPLQVDDFVDAYFSTRLGEAPFDYARRNLKEASAGHATNTACPWRVAILKAHEMFEMAAPYLDTTDLDLLKSKLGSVFADNYASVPHTSIERLLALHDAGVLEVIALGDDYQVTERADGIEVANATLSRTFDALIDARGQVPMGIDDLGFAGLVSEHTVSEMAQGSGVHLTPLVPTTGYVQCVSLPILLTRRPFVQGLDSCAKLGLSAGQSIIERLT